MSQANTEKTRIGAYNLWFLPAGVFFEIFQNRLELLLVVCLLRDGGRTITCAFSSTAD
ncbi:MAG: hypothetical protein JRI22_08130 [Deltaproteobacteria bacterium]|nr:hypothetical protein [Deltaproteobacteria bacterium]